MPEWLSLGAAIIWTGLAFQLVMALLNWRLSRRVQRLQQRIASDVAEIEPYRPIIAAIDEHDAECTTYQATQLVIALFAIRIGMTVGFDEDSPVAFVE